MHSAATVGYAPITMAEGLGDGPATELVVVTTNAADVDVVAAWLHDHGPELPLLTCRGFYPGMAALARGARVVVIDVGLDVGRDYWRLAELRERASTATVVVLADATLLAALTRAWRADLAVTGVAGLPPLRELLLGAAPTWDQTSRRRSTR